MRAWFQAQCWTKIPIERRKDELAIEILLIPYIQTAVIDFPKAALRVKKIWDHFSMATHPLLIWFQVSELKLDVGKAFIFW
jgi:hypothetical protein